MLGREISTSGPRFWATAGNSRKPDVKTNVYRQRVQCRCIFLPPNVNLVIRPLHQLAKFLPDPSRSGECILTLREAVTEDPTCLHAAVVPTPKDTFGGASVVRAITTRIDRAKRKSMFIAAALSVGCMRYSHTRTRTQQSHREDKQCCSVTKRA